jgi:predicted dehydrogenase
MSETIRVGIVGATVTPGGSGWGANAHVPAIKALPGYDLFAVCTQHAETAQASRDAFGAEIGFDNFATMVAEPGVDLAVVVVRVPGHYDLVMQALQAGKAVYCEWPLGRNAAEAERMATLAAERSLRTIVGLQARSDPSVRYARELIEQGFVGEVLNVSQRSVSQAVTERGNGRIWQGDRRNGANTLTIAGGHAIDALCYLVGEFATVSASLATKVTQWHNTDTGETMTVDSPDWIAVNGRTVGGAEVSFLTATVPFNPSGNRLEIYGTEGTLVISGGSLNLGPNKLEGARGRDALAVMEPPARLVLAPPDVPNGPPRNVAAVYARYAAEGESFQPDFAHAVKRHKLIEAIEQSSAESRTVEVPS